MKKLLILVLVLLVLLSAVVPVFAGSNADHPSRFGGTGDGPPGWSQVNPGAGGSDGPGEGPVGH